MKEKEFMEKAWALLNSGKYEKALKGKQVAVIGAGGAGGNIVEYMAKNGLNRMEGVETIVINSDSSILSRFTATRKKIVIGNGPGGGPKGADGSRRRARKMIDEARESLEVQIGNYPVIVTVAALGGGTGSELIVELSKMGVRAGKATIAIPVLPFSMESSRRGVAKSILEELKNTGATVAVMDNDFLLKPELMGLPSDKAFAILNRVIMKKIEEIHAAARKAVMDEIVKDMLRNMELEPEISSENPTMLDAPAIEIPVAPQQAVEASMDEPAGASIAGISRPAPTQPEDVNRISPGPPAAQ